MVNKIINHNNTKHFSGKSHTSRHRNDRNLGSELGQVQKCGRIKLVN